MQGLITKAQTCEVLVIYVQHNAGIGRPLEPNTDGWAIHYAIAPVQRDIVIQKTTPDSFHKTHLQNALDTNGIKNFVVAGIQTELCIDTTCRRAFSLGYDVILAKDAHSTWDRGRFKAVDIIEYHNDVLKWVSSSIDFLNRLPQYRLFQSVTTCGVLHVFQEKRRSVVCPMCNGNNPQTK